MGWLDGWWVLFGRVGRKEEEEKEEVEQCICGTGGWLGLDRMDRQTNVGHLQAPLIV